MVEMKRRATGEKYDVALDNLIENVTMKLSDFKQKF